MNVKGDFTYADVEDNAFAFSRGRIGYQHSVAIFVVLKTYGHGGLNGIETLGVGKIKKIDF